jgi:hypothetical protein
MNRTGQHHIASILQRKMEKLVLQFSTSSIAVPFVNQSAAGQMVPATSAITSDLDDGLMIERDGAMAFHRSSVQVSSAGCGATTVVFG